MGVVLQRLLQLHLRGHGVGEVAAELGTNLVDECLLLLWIGTVAGGRAGTVGAHDQESKR